MFSQRNLHLQTFSCKNHRFYFMEMEIRTSPQLDSGLTSSRIPRCFQWIPLAPIMEKLSLPQENHGAVCTTSSGRWTITCCHLMSRRSWCGRTRQTASSR